MTLCPPLSEGTDPVKLDKIKLLRDLANRWKLDAIHLTKTHDQNPVALGPLQEWNFMLSTPIGGKHSTAMLTSLPPNDTGVDRSPPLPPLPYRAFELKEVKAYNKAILQDYTENHLEGINAFSKWDKAKRLICTHAIETWSKKVRARGRHLKVIAKRCAKLRIDLHCMPISY
jgi:hypothetical protein